MSFIPLRPMDNIENSIYLFVVGKFDKEVLNCLFDGEPVIVEFLGSCNSVESVAQAFAQSPNSFFLVDRDHFHKEKDLDWNRFQTGETNLLIWPKKELENYYIDPDFLIHTEFSLKGVTLEQLRSQVRKLSQKRLYLDVTNYVIVSMREFMKENWITILTNPDDCPDKETALTRIIHDPGLPEIKKRVKEVTLESEIKSRFHSRLNEMTGESDALQYGVGKWLDMVSGKSILKELISSSGLFPNFHNGKQWVGQERMIDIARLLISNNNKEVNTERYDLPQDFIKLRQLVLQRAKQLPLQEVK